jgi:methylglyoxal reductase
VFACPLEAGSFDLVSAVASLHHRRRVGHGSSERLLGHLVAGVSRDSLVISSKVGYFAGTATHPYLPGAMRRQLEATLENLRTDHLDIYFLHNSSFGDNDQYLDGAIEQMRAFRQQGLIEAVGMRGPHRFATDRLVSPPSRAGSACLLTAAPPQP